MVPGGADQYTVRLWAGNRRTARSVYVETGLIREEGKGKREKSGIFGDLATRATLFHLPSSIFHPGRPVVFHRTAWHLLFPVSQLDQVFEVEIRVMRLKQEIPARLAFGAPLTLALCLFATDRQVFAFEQQQPPATAPVVQSPVTVPAAPTGPEVQLTADEAVRMALENNLGVKSDRLSPQISNFNVAQARSAFNPALFSTTQTRSSTSPPDFLASGGTSTTTTS